MALHAKAIDSPIDIASRRAHPHADLATKLRDSLTWRRAAIAAGCSIVTCMVIAGWFVLLSALYESFSRPLY